MCICGTELVPRLPASLTVELYAVFAKSVWGRKKVKGGYKYINISFAYDVDFVLFRLRMSLFMYELANV